VAGNFVSGAQLVSLCASREMCLFPHEHSMPNAWLLWDFTIARRLDIAKPLSDSWIAHLRQIRDVGEGAYVYVVKYIRPFRGWDTQRIEQLAEEICNE
jgi:hypothetical protein